MKKRHIVGFGIGCILLTLFCLSLAQGAQSSADAVVDSAKKEALRKEVVGDKILPGEQEEYVIGHGDVLSVSVYGEGSMAAANVAYSRPAVNADTASRGNDTRTADPGVQVRMDGRISLAHIGDVHVAGMTLTQAADYLKKLYLSVFDDPIVTVVLIQSNSRRYTVMGQVNNPGIFYLDFPVTIVQAIARSGGFNEWANHDVTVIRKENAFSGSGTQESSGKRGKIVFDYDDFLKGKHIERNIYLQPDDVVIVH